MSSSVLFSTNIATAKKLKELIYHSGRKLKLEIEATDYHIVEFLKEREQSELVRKFPVYYSGTLIYKNKKNDEALKLIYEDFDSSTCSLPEHIYGMYAIIIIKNGKLFFFIDESSLYKMYYVFNGNDITIFTSFYILAKGLNLKKINSTVLIEKCFQCGILTDKTIFSDIKRMLGDKILIYDFSEQAYSFKPRAEAKQDVYLNATFDDYSHRLSDRILGIGLRVTNLYKNIAMNMTGGLDSRMVLGALLSNSAKPKLLYGKGNSYLTNTKDEDAKIVELISKKYSLQYEFMDWSTSSNFNVLEGLKKFWEYFVIYGNNTNILEYYSNILPQKMDFAEFGYFGEPFRNVVYLEALNATDSFTFDEALSKYMDYDWKSFLCSVDVYESWREDVKAIIKNMTGQWEVVTPQGLSSLVIRYRKEADTMMHNFLNQYMDGFSFMGDSHILDLNEQVPLQYKDKAKFMISVLLNVNKDILDYPVFSHCMMWKYQSSKGILQVPCHRLIKKTIVDKCELLGIKEPLRKIYSLVAKKSDKTSIEHTNIDKDKLYEDINLLQDELNLNLISPKNFTGDYRALYDYYLYLILIKDVVQG